MQSRHNASVDGTRLDHGILVPLHTQRKCDPYSTKDITESGSRCGSPEYGRLGALLIVGKVIE